MEHEIVQVCSAGKSAPDWFTDHFCLQDIDKKRCCAKDSIRFW